ncbi:MAG: YceH family protein [gamma proteobacterium endosymbiont of Lamellibrachia anaximandri]|nr:YceH family protein [gamma proteobacterium endosymbiont of Lamellibrachia anaximandri]MBL3533458.1 YceH family protein [gamma proteobacterium endosymbiont of Lamellibrachia anaximandri]
MTNQPDTEANNEPLFTPVEARILGVLMEKQRTTPDNYPLTLNALVQACNQKTSRNPVMQLTQGEVGHTVNLLRDRELIRSSFSGRAERYEQKLGRHLELGREEQAVLCVLLLRGPQTLGELRTHGSRLADFTGLEDVRDALELLMAQDPSLVATLPKGPGRREDRYVQLLSDEPKEELSPAPAATETTGEADRLAALEEEVRQLRAEIDTLWRLTGLQMQRASSDEK